jgi:Chaperone of endosialidase
MATTVRAIELMLPGSFGKETLSNDGMQNLALGISGAATIALTSVDHTLTTDNQGEAMRFVLILTGALTANVNVIVPAESRVYVADNRTTGAFTVTFKTATGGGVAVDQGARTLVYADGLNVYPVASGTGGGGGSGAPTDASYLVGAAHTLLTGERVVTNTATVTWDLATAGQAKATIPPAAVSYTHIQNVTPTRLLGRFTAGAGDVQEITPGTGLTLDASGVLSATAVGQPLDATLTALAGLATGANQLPYFTGTDTSAQTPFTPFARTVLDDADQATMQATLGVVPGTTVQPLDATLTALAGVTTGANTLPFFTGTDTASTTALTAFMRSLLDDPDAATARSTLGVAGGGGSSDFLGLTDTPDTYSGQAGKGVTVNGTATGLEFTTATTGSYDLGLTWAGTLPASQVLLRYPFPRAVDFPAGLTGSRGVSAVAATALTTLDLRKNNVSVGSAQWAAAASAATFTMASATSFAAGDILTVHAPASVDATLADLGLSLAGTRAVAAGEMGATTWLGLTDTPDAYTGQGGNLVTVNSGATALDYAPFTAFARTLLDDTTQGAMQTTLGLVPGTHVQAQDAELQAIAGLTSAADRLPYFTGLGTAALATFTAAGRTLAGAADAAAQRTALALGTMSQQDAGAVAITGGTAQLTGTYDGTYTLSTAEFLRTKGVVVLDSNFASISSLYTTMNAAGAADKHAIRCAGTAPSYFGGPVTMASTLAVTGQATFAETVTGSRGYYAPQNAADNTYALYSDRNAGGTNRHAINCAGTAPSYFGGTVQVVGSMSLNGGIDPAIMLMINWKRASGPCLRIKSSDTDGGNDGAAQFLNLAGVVIGSITTTASATAYNTTSDMRLKHAVAPLTAALERVQALRPVAFKWQADDSPGVGFLAHELQQHIPDAVTGMPDEVNGDGSIKPQQVDNSKLVPWLTAALQETLAQVQALTARVAVLEGGAA